jgi:hypothetical protein
MRILIEELDARGGTTLYEPAVFCEAHGREEADRMGVRVPEPWQCCESSWDHAHRVLTRVTVLKDDTRRCQVCCKDELDAEFQKTLAMLEAL